VVSLAKAKGVVLSVFHNRRWDSDFLTVHDVVNQSLLGKLTEVLLHNLLSSVSATSQGDNIVRCID
jgi:predicted dehydrogenase